MHLNDSDKNEKKAKVLEKNVAVFFFFFFFRFYLSHLMTKPREDSDQPGHPPSLISLRCALNG